MSQTLLNTRNNRVSNEICVHFVQIREQMVDITFLQESPMISRKQFQLISLEPFLTY